LCSRVTFVNFTVTRSSLQSQCLHEVLRAERPEVYAKRADLLKLQGEFHLRLRHLEKELLQALNDSKGSILNDEKVITTLETLKTEAAEITRKVKETDTIMTEVEAVSEQYRTLASSCSSIYFTLEGMNTIHFLYQYALKLFLEIFQSILSQNPKLNDVKDHTARLNILIESLFQVVYNRVARGMLHDDRITFAVLFARIRLKGRSEPQYDAEFDHLLRGKEIVVQSDTIKIDGLTSEQKTALLRLSRLPPFKEVSKYIADNMEEFKNWVNSANATINVPKCWNVPEPLTPVGEVMYETLVVQAFRKDNVYSILRKFVLSIMGEHFLHSTEQEMDMVSVVENEIKAQTPMLLCSAPGYDVSGRVDDLVAETNNSITSIALGSAEGYSDAEKAISASVKSGRWVLLKNVHLATTWLVSLEKKLHILNPHANFRLFMTMEINPKVPVNLLRASRIFVYEPPPGIKANLLRTFSTVSVTRMSQAPSERARLYFLLAWFHAIVQERLRYAPLGWSKAYEFSESDQRVAFDMIDTWIASVSQNRANIPPEKLPWDAFSMLLGQSIYGGKIDNDFDQKLLQSFIDRLFTKRSFESEFPLITSVNGRVGDSVKIPEGVRREQFVNWCEGLPEYQSPSWLGLPNNAEKVILSNLGEAAVVNLLKMRILAEDDELEYVPEISHKDEGLSVDVRPQWMKSLQQSVRNWLTLLPNVVTPIKRTLDNIKDPLFRYFEREVNLGAKLLHDMRQDLTAITEICEGNRKQTNDLRQLIEQLAKGVIPQSWNRYAGPKDLTVIQWMIDLAERMKQLQRVSKVTNTSGAKELKNLKVWLGGLFIPEAYITATRQYVAQANQWSLEELYLNITIADDSDKTLNVDDCSFIVSGLKLQGAVCKGNLLSLVDTITTELSDASIRWTKIDPRNPPVISGDDVKLPVYLNQMRSELLFTVDMTTTGSVPARTFYERGVAFIASFLSG